MSPFSRKKVYGGEKIHKVYKVRTYGNERPPELVKREFRKRRDT
jgi:hypothetical protein